MHEWRGRKAPLPADWQQRRHYVFTRDYWMCVDCGWYDPTGRTLECDHLGAPDDHRVDVLATRCGKRTPSNCHGKRTSAAGHAARPRPARPAEDHPGIL